MMQPEKQAIDTDEVVIIPVIEEQVKIETSVVETGRIKVSKHVAEETETVNISLTHEEHFIEHIPSNAFVEELPSIRQEGDTMIIPVLKEVMVKRLMLVEEIRITKHTVQTNEPQQVTLRKENITIERTQ